jgi:hypothetical protein
MLPRLAGLAAAATLAVGCAGGAEPDGGVELLSVLRAFDESGQPLHDLGYPDSEIGEFVIEPPGTTWPLRVLATGARSERLFYLMLYRRDSDAREVAARAARTDPVFHERRSFVVSRNIVAVVQPSRPATRAFVASVLSKVERR